MEFWNFGLCPRLAWNWIRGSMESFCASQWLLVPFGCAFWLFCVFWISTCNKGIQFKEISYKEGKQQDIIKDMLKLRKETCNSYFVWGYMESFVCTTMTIGAFWLCILIILHFLNFLIHWDLTSLSSKVEKGGVARNPFSRYLGGLWRSNNLAWLYHFGIYIWSYLFGDLIWLGIE